MFRESNALLFLKNTYLKDFNLYKQSSANGRYYWGEGNYSVPDIDDLKPKMKLSGCNWLHTLQPNWLDYSQEKKYDISCMFGYPTPETVYEHDICQTEYYDPHRKNLMEKLGDNYKIAGLVNGQRIPQQEYYNKMFRSKIIMAPLGYGEMAPRDIESAMFGSVLVKPDISYIDTKPNIYLALNTYISVYYDWSNLNEKIDYVLSNFDELNEKINTNIREKFEKEYDYEKLCLYFYNLFRKLNQIKEV